MKKIRPETLPDLSMQRLFTSSVLPCACPPDELRTGQATGQKEQNNNIRSDDQTSMSGSLPDFQNPLISSTIASGTFIYKQPIY